MTFRGTQCGWSNASVESTASASSTQSKSSISVKGTIEERVLDVLENRINIFEETVGGLDPILGDAERDLAHILRLGGEERERALTQFEEQLERRMKAARTAEEKLRDFIMETKSYSTAIATMLAGRES